ncbi:MAG: hypothetical protein QOH83_1238, partial [Solirubrobacteraceae bacterium]|nr:hypothetical protein [Solirubrobacteraceae bacterium]
LAAGLADRLIRPQPAVPLGVERLDAITARAIGIRNAGALLARPDGTPASWLAHDTDAVPALRAAVRSATAHTSDREVSARHAA